ncbi:16S rRNA (cytosine(1407)-C(5))-methyltransferase RsmF [Pectobacterium aroidearum]|uniref:Ribosomal RNA small subunit methyltransferase F n=1 Tax=Pectobacterium aroidearum TaxID=1201031 RepID=A0ABR5Z8F1_9GAMM|nr:MULTISPECIES: 16S rRNA (cytosine(1407)-C(5))-methyltransferase RsmF [Pectobacterium]MBA5198063.1 16S rRNA (cytosine(1407)-C(5))-methyltransferase RsmF [Pectobacterium aroidearum]MBA5227433.1 16S rRNA (cytosine(1407)-C(5))-methyltransferase RsmF [Pectobacterium aroidearum]MBA5230856.1 16S rRNA (cytosine(1407)-C(5))-methyltransferase RsmF [Pectobacterium aroidearum]MBA5736002.1 16S rRNA (cytosine(1407)-C(5))-methyltransferase RsmF [Pectobacterium aroidearum]UXK02153.1 16S rRNA (cytosine(1407)
MAKFTPANLPAEFLDTMRDIMPSSLSMADFIAACQRPLRRSIRVNTLKISVEAFLRLVQPYGWQLEPIPWCQEGFWLLNAEEENMRLGNTLEHLSGLFYIQEASSMLPVSALFHRNEALETVLDVAAAPGSKTTQIAARLDNKGAIVANEYSASRVKVLHANISRCGVSNTAMTHFDGRVFGAALPEYFDAILLDAPCSGEGVVRKDPAAMSHWSRESITEIAATQRDLILSAFHALKPGGVMIYSTCTLNKQENQQVCHWLQAQFPDACEFESLRDLFTDAERATTEDGFLHVFPQIYDSEGFFVARLRKTASVPLLPRPGYKVGKFPFSPVAPKDCVPLIQAARKQGIHWDETLLQLWQRDSEIWLFPAALTSAFGHIKFSRIGIKLAERFPKGFRWQHEAVVALADPNANNAYALTDDIACEWFQGKDCYPEPLPTADELILTYQNTPVGLAKRINSRIKNSLPRDLVRDGASSAQQRAKE